MVGEGNFESTAAAIAIACEPFSHLTIQLLHRSADIRYPSCMAKDFYSTLGVSRDASSEDIKKAYRKLSKKLHPDKHKGDKTAGQKFKEINEAYETLSDPPKKSTYDRFGSTGNAGGGGPRWL